MAVLTYTTAIQSRIAYLLRNTSYANLTAAEKEIIDGTWSSGPLTTGQAYDALTHIQQIGQWFMLSEPANVPSEWESWLVARTCMLASGVIDPDRRALFVEMNDDAEMAAIDAYGRNLITYDPGSTPEASVLTVQNIRYYVLSLCVRRDPGWETVEGTRRRRPRKWVPFEIIDAMIERVMRNVWNRANWTFKRRQSSLTMTPYDLTGATWTNSTKTLTKTDGLAVGIPAGSVVIIRGGTGATVGYYISQTTTTNDDSIVLTTSIGAAADGHSDISALVISVVPSTGNETFHSFASRHLTYADSSAPGSVAEWVDGTDMSVLRAYDLANMHVGRPRWFRFEENAGTLTWHVSPPPDRPYVATGEFYVKGPSLTTLSATTTALARFPVEFHHVLKDAVYAEVLDRIGDRHGAQMKEQIEREIELMLPRFTDIGDADIDQTVRDVYRDHAAQQSWSSGGYYFSDGGVL